MAQLKAVSSAMRISNAEKARVCSVLNLAHDVNPQTVVNFVEAIETLYNKGTCSARVSMIFDVER